MVTDSVPLPGIGLFIFACLQCLVLCAAISEMYPFLPRLSSLLAYTSSQYSLIILFISVRSPIMPLISFLVLSNFSLLVCFSWST